MAINFNALPDALPNAAVLIPAGQYKAIIANAEMKTPKEPTKPDYLNVTLDIFDASNKKLGRVWDIMTESDSQYVQFKIKAFCSAIGFTPNGSFELRDLTKISKGKQVLVTISIDDKSEPNRNQVNIFNNPYAPIPAEMTFEPVSKEEDLPFAAPTRATEPAAPASASDY